MENNKLNLIELKHNIDMLRIQFKGNDSIKDVYFAEDNIYGKGLKQGYKQANEGYNRYIDRLEKLLEGVNIYE
jgi:hypothetical protein